MSALVISRGARPFVVAALRRKAAGQSSTTRDERVADQIAFIRGLTDHAKDERGLYTSRIELTPLGKLWLAAADAFGDGVEVEISPNEET